MVEKIKNNILKITIVIAIITLSNFTIFYKKQTENLHKKNKIVNEFLQKCQNDKFKNIDDAYNYLKNIDAKHLLYDINETNKFDSTKRYKNLHNNLMKNKEKSLYPLLQSCRNINQDKGNYFW
jgi:uncharacterized pyridoxal phosphate-containing UPF0001 family protein